MVLAKLLGHIKEILQVPLSNIFAWTDSAIVIGWLSGNPCVCAIIEVIPSECWRHSSTEDNLADSASRGLLPSEPSTIICGERVPPWLALEDNHWPKIERMEVSLSQELRVSMVTVHHNVTAFVNPDKVSSYTRFVHVTAWTYISYDDANSTGTNTVGQTQLNSLTSHNRKSSKLKDRYRINTSKMS